MRKLSVILILIMLLVLLLAWAPWITPASAGARAEGQFTSAWQGVIDGCGLNCQGCGAKNAVKVLFGYRLQLEYACGLIPADLPEYHKITDVFVSSLGTVHSLPMP